MVEGPILRALKARFVSDGLDPNDLGSPQS